MKKLLLLLLIILTCSPIYSQTLTLQAGTSFSSSPILDMSGGSIFDETSTGYAVFIGMEYLESEMFNLSTNLGYVSKGGSDEFMVSNNSYTHNTQELKKIYLEMDYISLNTLAEVKFPLTKSIYPFLSVGPRVDFYAGGSTYWEERINIVDYGMLLGGGIKYRFAKYSFGIRADYYLNFEKTAEWGNSSGNSPNITNNTFTLTLCTGFQLISGRGE